ncbi:MAG: CHASE2 domain-containing protein [Microcoleus sp. SIO2G3]|nr:CHASE2 domain-containing protein [Microcoleus sp. SIO2G3]
MGKLVVLIASEGSFENGFPVTLRVGEEDRPPSVEITGRLPPTLEIPQFYRGWADTYRRLGLRSRLEASVAQVTNVSKLEICLNAAQLLRDRFNAWLHSESFRPIREKLLEQLMPSDEVRLIIQTENIWLRRLPWHQWDLCDRYPKAEIALSAPIYEFIKPVASSHTKVRILAILGNSTGINTQADRLLLEQLPDAEISFLVEPQRHELTEELWKQSWDILFFAGHSSSQPNCETGEIYLNQTDSLTIEQLKLALRKAVERGLKIAIFNSCDGLGLARNLADLQIPQIIVMREPVPDQICQKFLKYFLAAFSRGESFYLAVREARERLQGWEDQFPCATWLPIICQNPAVLPPTWEQLSSPWRPPTPTDKPPVVPESPDKNGSRIRQRSPRNALKGRQGFIKVVLMSLVITSLILVGRQFGLFQAMELQAFDQLMRSRPTEEVDSRLLVVTVTEEDIQAQKQKQEPGRGSVSEPSLLRLLEKLESYNPRAIGLDIYRDFPVDPKYPELAKRLKESNRLITVCKVSNPQFNDPGKSPPPEALKENLGFTDFVLDSNGVLRRHLLAMEPPPASSCTASYALSSKLAFRYLKAEGISPKVSSNGYLQLGTTVFQPLETNAGGYRNMDDGGHQVLLNYRSSPSPLDVAGRVTLSEVLNGQVNPNAVKGRIVLIGVTAPSAKDYFFTPYSNGQYQDMPGVVVHAQMVSQILSAVLDQRPLLWVWSEWGETLWIFGWALTGGLFSWRCQFFLRWGLVGGTLFVLYGLCFGLLIQGCWVPLVPSVLALVSTSVSVAAYSTFLAQRQQSTFAI